MYFELGHQFKTTRKISSRIFLLLFLQVFLGQIYSSSGQEIDQFSCIPSRDCANGVPGDKVPDPTDCHNYYLCITAGEETVPSDVPLPCPDGMFFDNELRECQIELKPCYNNCTLHCPLICENDFDYIPDAHNCSVYHLCMPDGSLLTLSCDKEYPFFNGYNCTKDAFACCDTCDPFCSMAYTETPFPYDCTKFYICTEIGVPTEDNLFDCGEGTFFDSTVGTCVANDPEKPCEPLCSLKTTSATTELTTFTTGMTTELTTETITALNTETTKDLSTDAVANATTGITDLTAFTTGMTNQGLTTEMMTAAIT